MNKEEFIELIKQYSLDTMFLSFLKRDHPAYINLVNAGSEAIPFALERLEASIGHDHDSQMIMTNNIWLLLDLLWHYTDHKCCEGYPIKDAGKMDKRRD